MTIFRFLLLLVSTLALSAGTLARAGDDVRFSKALSAAELSSAGLTQLSSDQLAILDALVRRDIAQSQFVARQPRPAQFSERLSPDERRGAGLELLSEAEQTQLDAFVQRLITPPAATLVSNGTGTSRASAAGQGVKIRRGPELHGSFSLMMAVGSHDYRAYGAGVVVTYADPAGNFGLAVGYSELHSKGGIYRGGYWDDYYRYRRPFGLLDPRW